MNNNQPTEGELAVLIKDSREQQKRIEALEEGDSLRKQIALLEIEKAKLEATTA